MKARYIQRGDSIDYTPTADVAAGDIIIFGKFRGVAKLDIKAGELGALALTGVYEIPKDAIAFAAGDVVSFNGDKAVAGSVASATKIGYATAAAAVGDAAVLVRLQQGLV